MYYEDEVENIVKKVITDEKLLSELLQGILSKKDKIRNYNFKILLQISILMVVHLME